jgi:hypothetical protein
MGDAHRERHQGLAHATWHYAYKRADDLSASHMVGVLLAPAGHGAGSVPESGSRGKPVSSVIAPATRLGRGLQAGGRWFDTTFAHQ